MLEGMMNLSFAALLSLSALPLLIAPPCAQAQHITGTGDSTGVFGSWRGRSRCIVRPSACTDEVVVYRIARRGAVPDSVTLDARKLVNGQEQQMGVLECRLERPAAQLDCVMPNGVWQFTVRGDSLTGELRLPDNTKYRDVRMSRAP
jgi:hypothetical protein